MQLKLTSEQFAGILEDCAALQPAPCQQANAYPEPLNADQRPPAKSALVVNAESRSC